MRIQMEPSFEAVDEVGPHVRAVADQAGFSGEEGLMLELAVVEALTNLVEHGGLATGAKAEIHLECLEGELSVRITDTGIPIPEILLGQAGPGFFERGWEDPMCLPESGMGLSMIKTIMDRVEYRPGPPNELRLFKKLPRKG